MSNDTECQMTQNVKWHKMSNDTKCQMTHNVKWQKWLWWQLLLWWLRSHKMSNDTECQMTQYEKIKEMTQEKWHMTHNNSSCKICDFFFCPIQLYIKMYCDEEKSGKSSKMKF